MKVKTSFIPSNRGWITIKRHLPIIGMPTLGGIGISVIWYLIVYPNQLFLSREAENPLLFIVLPLIAFIYVIFASVAVSSVFDEYKIISTCVVKDDLETFLLHRDEQLPLLMHILIAVPSLVLIVMTAIFNYKDDVYIGVIANFCVTFILTLIWMITTELDDFRKSIWFKETINPDWYTINPVEYFKTQKETSRTL